MHCMHTYVYICMYVCECMHAYVRMYACMYIYMCVCIYYNATFITLSKLKFPYSV